MYYGVRCGRTTTGYSVTIVNSWSKGERNIEELLNLDMEPKPKSQRWTSTNEEEDKLTLKVGGRGKDWDLPFREVFDVLGYRFQRDGTGTQRFEKTLRKGMGSWWRDAKIYPSKSVSLKTKCQRVISHVFSTALKSSAN